ncbi:MAG: hypothetical protein H0X72_06285 [Acidobacteria bacterium]|jgi:hypothetical protein|nr:hypothetical protein [Acidobacteriota bacterium]
MSRKQLFQSASNKYSIQTVETHLAAGEPQTKDVVDIETSTPKAKHFIDALLAADFYNSEEFSIAIRQPRSIISGDSLRELTEPLVVPATDIFEELWQFSHITVGFVGRNFIAACLLAYGLIHQQILLMIAGLLFLQLLPILLAIGFGAWTRTWKLVGQSASAFIVAIILLTLGGVSVAALTNPPLKYDEFNSTFVGFLISLAVGIAAGLANSDDVGRREFLGLAATAQIAIIPVWFGICFVFGFPTTTGQDEITTRALGFGLNILTIIIASLATYILLGATNRRLPDDSR